MSRVGDRRPPGSCKCLRPVTEQHKSFHRTQLREWINSADAELINPGARHVRVPGRKRRTSMCACQCGCGTAQSNKAIHRTQVREWVNSADAELMNWARPDKRLAERDCELQGSLLRVVHSGIGLWRWAQDSLTSPLAAPHCTHAGTA